MIYVMQRNELSIHKETVNIYYDNIDVADCIYSFIIAQQYHTKKLMSEKLQFFDSHEDYVMNYLTQIESESKDVLDMVPHKDTKFLFYQFHQYLAQKSPKSRWWTDIFSWQYNPGKPYSKRLNKKYYAL